MAMSAKAYDEFSPEFLLKVSSGTTSGFVSNWLKYYLAYSCSGNIKVNLKSSSIFFIADLAVWLLEPIQ
jgi:hypothetical protein